MAERVLPLSLLVALLAGCAHLPSTKDVQSAEIHYDLGVTAVEAGEPQEALKELREAMRLNPRFAEPHNALGLLYHFSYRRLDEARAAYERAVELRPEFPEAWNNLGVLLAEMGHLKQAREAFQKALADPLYKTPFMAQVNLGWLQHVEGDSVAGERTIRAALTAQPGFCVGHRQLARILDGTGRAQEAQESWERFARYCPEEPEALLRQGMFQLRRGELREAHRSFRRCLRRGESAYAEECRAGLARLPDFADEEDEDGAAERSRNTVRGARDLDADSSR